MPEPSFAFELVDFVQGPALALRGEFDPASAPMLRVGLRTLLEQNRSPVFLDLLRLTFVDSNGVAALVEATQSVRDDVPLIMVDPSPTCAHVLNTLGVDFEIWLP